jgi:hypothetical protein
MTPTCRLGANPITPIGRTADQTGSALMLALVLVLAAMSSMCAAYRPRGPLRLLASRHPGTEAPIGREREPLRDFAVGIREPARGASGRDEAVPLR